MPRHPLAIMLGVLVLAGVMIGYPKAFAGSTVGDFEIDGNLVDNPMGGPIDWSTDPEGNIPHPGLPNRVDFKDASGSGDGIFGQGSKELEPGAWICLTGSAPSKSDIVKGSVAIRAIAWPDFTVSPSLTRIASTRPSTSLRTSARLIGRNSNGPPVWYG